jgi:hypothetical protein
MKMSRVMSKCAEKMQHGKIHHMKHVIGTWA